MITEEQYFRGKEHSDAQGEAATNLLFRVNALLDHAIGVGAFSLINDPDTGSQISGSKGGSGDGGFRLPDSPTGAPNSSHKQAMAVDVFDPAGRLDDFCTDGILETYGLYREAPEATTGWCHLTSRAPKSGRRTFQP